MYQENKKGKFKAPQPMPTFIWWWYDKSRKIQFYYHLEDLWFHGYIQKKPFYRITDDILGDFGQSLRNHRYNVKPRVHSWIGFDVISKYECHETKEYFRRQVKKGKFKGMSLPHRLYYERNGKSP